jgi:hypothetical protein
MNQENINAQIPDVFKLKIKLLFFKLVISSRRWDNESEQMLIIVGK